MIVADTANLTLVNSDFLNANSILVRQPTRMREFHARTCVDDPRKAALSARADAALSVQYLRGAGRRGSCNFERKERWGSQGASPPSVGARRCVCACLCAAPWHRLSLRPHTRPR